MIICVVPDLVPFVDDATNKRRVTLRVYSHQEKRRLYIRCLENVQNLWRPLGVRAVIECDCNLMLAAGALVIKRWEFCKLNVLRGEITVSIYSERSRPVHPILVNSDNLAVADVSYCVAGRYEFEGLPRWVV